MLRNYDASQQRRSLSDTALCGTKRVAALHARRAVTLPASVDMIVRRPDGLCWFALKVAPAAFTPVHFPFVMLSSSLVSAVPVRGVAAICHV